LASHREADGQQRRLAGRRREVQGVLGVGLRDAADHIDVDVHDRGADHFDHRGSDDVDHGGPDDVHDGGEPTTTSTTGSTTSTTDPDP
jgi:hypothetical protein